ncbi:MAG: hypothetical protein OXH51_00055 [Gemmatimonadetes bacterium]|nr:hypothetical protein [Gemmatimonadota bacterium]MCY3609916.1 hypothetical protein [Gemmatimonadota bacterium]MCY3676738.1 hypothetical protein [Gemmatimonadota bacterium]
MIGGEHVPVFYYVPGIGEKFQWRQVLETLEAGEGPAVVSEEGGR